MAELSLPFSVSLVLVARAASAFGGILLSVVVARLAGAEGLGMFTVFLTLLAAIGLLARRGVDTLLLRAVSWAGTSAGGGGAVALLMHGLKRTLPLALLFGAVGAALLASGWFGAPLPGGVAGIVLALPLMTGLALVAGYLKGRLRPWIAPLFELGGISMVAALLLAALAWIAGPAAAREGIVGALLAALLVLGAVAVLLVRRDWPREGPLPRLDPGQTAELRRGQVDFTTIAVAGFLTQAGAFVLVAPFLSEAELGLLRAAERLALLVSFPVLAIDPVISPRIVRMARGGDPVGLRRLVRRSLALCIGMALCAAVPLLVWPERALGLMGPDFAAAAPYLRAMVAAQILVAAVGPLVVLMNMSGRERHSMWTGLAAFAVALVLMPLGSALFGPAGFLGAYLSVTVLRLAVIVYLVRGPAGAAAPPAREAGR